MRPAKLFCAAAAIAAAPAAVLPGAAAGHDGPAMAPDSRLVSAGDSYSLVGEGWSTGDGCESRVWITRMLNHSVPAGSARIRDDGSFTFIRRIPRSTPAGARLRFQGTQYCDGIGTTREATVRVGRPEHGCPGSIGVDGKAYVLRVTAGLRCARGAGAIGPFIDTDIPPLGFECAWSDPAVGYDAVCTKAGNRASRVTARRISEV